MLCAFNRKPVKIMLALKKSVQLIFAFVIFEIIFHFFGSLVIFRNPASGVTSLQIWVRLFYELFGIVLPLIVAISITKLNRNSELNKFSKRIKLVILLVLISWIMIVLLNTINPTNRIISSDEWNSKFIGVTILSIIQIIIGIVVIYFVKPKK